MKLLSLTTPPVPVVPEVQPDPVFEREVVVEPGSMMPERERSRLERLADAELPLRELSGDVLLHLRRPFTPEAVKFKVQSEWTSGALLVAYIDARLVIERLNTVWPWWEDKYEPIQGGLRCTLRLFDPWNGPGFEMKHSDVGLGGDPKTHNSDALKRAAVHFGIGMSIYALAQIKLNVGSGDKELRTQKKRKQNRQKQWVEVEVPIIDAQTEEWLRRGYAGWLRVRGEARFGPVLDHGDELGAQGMDLDSPRAAAEATGGDAPQEGEVVPEPLKDERAVELNTLINGVYQQYRKLAPRKLPPAAFQAKVRAAAHSHEALEVLLEELQGLLLGEQGS